MELNDDRPVSNASHSRTARKKIGKHFGKNGKVSALANWSKMANFSSFAFIAGAFSGALSQRLSQIVFLVEIKLEALVL